MTSIEIDGDVFDARITDSWLQQMRGHMFRRTEPDYALVFQFDSVKRRGIHMVAVPFPLDVLWVNNNNTIVRIERLSSWTGYAVAQADTIIELPVDTVNVSQGDSITIRE